MNSPKDGSHSFSPRLVLSMHKLHFVNSNTHREQSLRMEWVRVPYLELTSIFKEVSVLTVPLLLMCSQNLIDLSSNSKPEMATVGGVWLSEEKKKGESFLRLHSQKINVAVMATRCFLPQKDAFLSQIVNIFCSKRSSYGEAKVAQTHKLLHGVAIREGPWATGSWI